MKRLTLLLLSTICLSVSAFAQRVSITDFCYVDSQNDVIATFSKQDIINRLKLKGFVVVDKKVYEPNAEHHLYYTLTVYKLYQRSTNTTVEIEEYPSTITFNSSSEAKAFVSEALKIGYIRPRQNQYEPQYVITSYEECNGIESLAIENNVVSFGFWIP